MRQKTEKNKKNLLRLCLIFGQLITFVFFGLWLVRKTQAEEIPQALQMVQPCQVTYTETFVDGSASIQQTEPTDQPIPVYPLAEKLTITVNVPNPNLYYSLFAYSQDSQGWLQVMRGSPPSKQIFNITNVADIYFEFDRQVVFEKQGRWSTQQITIIPQFTNDQWQTTGKLYVGVIYKNTVIAYKEPGLPNLCYFVLEPKTQCSDYQNYNMQSTIEQITLSFNNVSSSSWEADNYSVFFQPSTPYTRGEFLTTKTEKNNNGLTVKIDSKLIKEAGYLNLIGLNNQAVCQTWVLPENQDFYNQLQKCQIIPQYSNNGYFNWKIQLKNIPQIILHPGWLKYINITANLKAETAVLLVLYEQNELANLMQSTPVTGINLIDQVTYNSLCNVHPCYSIQHEKLTDTEIAINSSSISPNKVYEARIVYFPLNQIYSESIDKKFLPILDSPCMALIANKVENLPSQTPTPLPRSIMTQFSKSTSDLEKIDFNNFKYLCDNAFAGRFKDDSEKNINKQYNECLQCVKIPGQVWTALGCLKTDLSGFVSTFFQVGLGVAGGIVLLLLVYGGFLFLTSAGNQETVQQAKEIITSAITGLILIIFAVLILRVILSDILKIPGFG